MYCSRYSKQYAPLRQVGEQEAIEGGAGRSVVEYKYKETRVELGYGGCFKRRKGEGVNLGH
jgi:hypothetical protein